MFETDVLILWLPGRQVPASKRFVWGSIGDLTPLARHAARRYRVNAVPSQVPAATSRKKHAPHTSQGRK